ncbi:DUF6585 family protein [Promicromonospora sp. NPDC057488]|uniref:DUF6585 family protein n=1 Tax=Promicromonospora sp. NPDC057488 TaxID=3346147 RepID=UPI00366F4A34
MSEATTYESVDQAARELRLGARRAVFTGAGTTTTAGEATGDQALHVFEEGVVVRGATGRVLPYRWEQARLVRVGGPPGRSSDRRARWSYGLLSTTTPPVVMGEFERIDVWGPALEAAITRATTPRVLDELAEGRTVPFGPVSATPEGLAIDGQVTPWADVTNLRIDDGYLQWKQRGEPFRSSVPADDVPNLLVLVCVADHLAAASLE